MPPKNDSNVKAPDALHEFAADVAADLHASDAAGVTDGVMKVFDIVAIVSIIQALIQFIRNCKNPPTPVPSPTPPVTGPRLAANGFTDGEVLIQAANNAYNERRHEFRGLEYNITVRQAMRASELKGRKNKRAEAVSVAQGILSRARETDPNKANAIAACVR